MIGIERQHVEAFAVRIDRPRAGEESGGIAHAEAAEGRRLHPVRRQVGLVDGLRVPAGRAGIGCRARDVGASTHGEVRCP
jgi:hypothetical protein